MWHIINTFSDNPRTRMYSFVETKDGEIPGSMGILNVGKTWDGAIAALMEDIKLVREHYPDENQVIMLPSPNNTGIDKIKLETLTEKKTDVHTRHCNYRSCKYGDEHICSVYLGYREPENKMTGKPSKEEFKRRRLMANEDRFE